MGSEGEAKSELTEGFKQGPTVTRPPFFLDFEKPFCGCCLQATTTSVLITLGQHRPHCHIPDVYATRPPVLSCVCVRLWGKQIRLGCAVEISQRNGTIWMFGKLCSKPTKRLKFIIHANNLCALICVLIVTGFFASVCRIITQVWCLRYCTHTEECDHLTEKKLPSTGAADTVRKKMNPPS